jgi:glutathione S-transferase
MFFEQYSHEPYIAVVRFWVAFAKDPPPADAIAERRAPGYRALNALERELSQRPYLVDDRFSIADIALYAYTHVAGEGGFELEGYPAIDAWLDRVAAEPGHVSISG